MKFDFDERLSDSPLVELVWRTHTVGGSFISSATNQLEIVVTRQKDTITVGVRGPETRARPAPVPDDAEIFGITFRPGAFLTLMPTSELVDRSIVLPQAVGRSFWLDGATWDVPTFDNADTFVDRLARQGLLAREPVVEAALQGQLAGLSERSVQRRFRRATGLTHGTMAQIVRARYAMSLLEKGASILDTVEQAGYYDQPHLTRSLRFFVGQTPAQIQGIRSAE